MPSAEDLRAYFGLADQRVAGASKEDVTEAARILARNVAHYQLKFGALPFENFSDMLRAETISPERTIPYLGGYVVFPDPTITPLISSRLCGI